MNDIIFSKSFIFCTFDFDKFHYTDHRSGVGHHYFAYMLCGKCKIITDTESVQIKEGDIFYIPNNCRYRSYWYGNPEIKFISLGFTCMPNFDNSVYPVQVISGAKKAHELFYTLSQKSRPNARDIGVFYTLAGMLIPLMKNVKLCRTEEIVRQSKQYLLKNPFAKAFEIAKVCAISEAALYFAFKKSSDITLNSLKNEILLDKAKDILITTNKTIENISSELQYSSASYFRKKFKQHFNMTPGEMRSTYRV